MRLPFSIITVLCIFTVVVDVSSNEAEEFRIVQTAQGPVKGYKNRETGLFSFMNIPYATAPTGPYRFKVKIQKNQNNLKKQKKSNNSVESGKKCNREFTCIVEISPGWFDIATIRNSILNSIINILTVMLVILEALAILATERFSILNNH